MKGAGQTFRVFLAALLVLLSVREGRAGEAYYLLMFGTQRAAYTPDSAHCFATFVRARWDGDGPPKDARLEQRTISWLPANQVVRLFALPEQGKNFDLHSTLKYDQRNGERVSLWGPYEIQADLYERAARQIALLESGQVRYKCTDFGYRSDRVSNCIHAVSSIVEGHRLRIAVPGYGEVASYAILKRMSPWLVDEGRVHSWVARELGLDDYPVVRRDLETSPLGDALPLPRILAGGRGAFLARLLR